MVEFTCIAYVPRRILKLYEAIYAYPKDVCDMAEEDIRLADEARESEHHDAQNFMYMYENQDICGAVKVIVVDDPAFERICVGDAERVELKTASVKGTVFGERAHDEI